MTDPGSNETAIRAAFAHQDVWCCEFGSPLTGLLCDLAGRRLDRSTRIGRRILDWPGQPDLQLDARPLRLFGGLHALVRRGRLPALARLYPPHPMPPGEVLWQEVAATLDEVGDELAPWLDRPPQTNEVARAAALMAGLLVVSVRTGLPLALYELGASAGLKSHAGPLRGAPRHGPGARPLGHRIGYAAGGNCHRPPGPACRCEQ